MVDNTVDINKNPQIPADPLVLVDLFREHASSSKVTTGSLITGDHAEAASETANVKLINSMMKDAQGNPIYVVEASLVQSQVSCDANASTASCNSDGSHIVDLKILGHEYGLVTPVNKPDPVTVNVPGLGTVTVGILEEIGSGANQPVNEPEGNQNKADLEVKAIHIKVVLTPVPGANNPIIELTLADAKAEVASGPSCPEAAHVSGRGLVAGATVCTVDGNVCDQTPNPSPTPDNHIVNVEAGRVDLPSTGGSEDRTVAHVGPVPDMTLSPTFTLLESDTGRSMTDGTVVLADAHSHTKVYVEKARIIDQNDPVHSPQSSPLISAQLLQTECHSSESGGTGTSTADPTTLLGVSIGGQDVCKALGVASAPCADPFSKEICCQVAPNTDACAALGITALCDGLGVKIFLNEQYCDGTTPLPPTALTTPTCSGPASGITVNAIHVYGNKVVGLPLNADAKVSSSHCDTAAPGAVSTPPPYGQSASLNEPPSTMLAFLFGSGAVGLLIPRRRRSTGRNGAKRAAPR